MHGRTVYQRYNGPSRWEFLKEVKQHVGDRIILGSGDLFSAHDCLRMMSQTGVDGVTVARGCIGNPWIFSQCRALAAGLPLPEPPTVLQQRQVLERHWDWLRACMDQNVLDHSCGSLASNTRVPSATLARARGFHAHPFPGRLVCGLGPMVRLRRAWSVSIN